MCKEQYRMSQKSKEKADEMRVIVKVIGGPGTGKTTNVVGNPELEKDGLFVDHLEEYNLNEQLLVTYTKGAVEEAKERLKKMTGIPKKDLDSQVRTIHSHAYQKMGVENGQLVHTRFKEDFCDEQGIEFDNEDTTEDLVSVGSDTSAGDMLFRISGWLKSYRLGPEDWDQCPVDYTGTGDIEFLLKAWEDYKSIHDKIEFAEMIEGVVSQCVSVLREGEYGDSEIENDREYLRSCMDDPGLNPEAVRNHPAFVDEPVLYVDEVQDLTYLQWDWYLCQKLAAEKVFLGGDDDQCLPGSQTVDTKMGPVAIEDVDVGTEVRSMDGNGEWSYQPISEKEKLPSDGTVFEIELPSTKMRVTGDHEMFSRVMDPEVDSPTNEWYYVYLMRDDNDRWRVGVTSDLRSRMNIERNARAIVPLVAKEDKQSALLSEQAVSLKNEIPTITFTQRQDEIMADEEMKRRLYEIVSPDPYRVSLGTSDIDHPVYYKKATTRGRTDSVNINVKMCGRINGSGSRSHVLSVNTRNKDVIESIDSDVEIEFGSREDRGDKGVRFRKSSTYLKNLEKLSRRVAAATGGDIVRYILATEDRHQFTVTKARNLVEGMYLPVMENNPLGGNQSVHAEEILSIVEVENDEPVYDIQVDGNHNFSAGGVGVHNSIYGWAGAEPEDQILAEEAETRVLEKTYRIPEEVWTACQSCIEQVDERQEKNIEPTGKGGEFIALGQQDANAYTIQEDLVDSGDAMILFRAKYHILEFTKQLNDTGIPYKHESLPFQTWSTDLVKVRDILATLCDDETITADELVTLVDHIPDGFVDVKQPGMLEYLIDDPEYDIEGLMEYFTFGMDGPTGKQFSMWYAKSACGWDNQEFNGYQGDALYANIRRERLDLQPEDVRVMTIHKSKGKEADTVVLGTDSTRTIMSNMDSDGEEDHRPQWMQSTTIDDTERRVMYVGMSRAERKLIMGEGFVTPDTCLEIDTLVGGNEE